MSFYGFSQWGYPAGAYPATIGTNTLPFGTAYGAPFGSPIIPQASVYGSPFLPFPVAGFAAPAPAPTATAATSVPKDIKVHYFDITGRAEAARLALIIGEIPFEDVRYTMESWAEVKDKMPFGQVPVLEVDGEYLAQTYAIVRFVGRIAGLYPTDAWTASKVDEFLYLIEDLNSAFKGIYSEPDAEVKQNKLQAIKDETIPKFNQLIEKTIAKGNPEFVVGDSLTIADLVLYATAGWLTQGAAPFFDGFGDDLYDNYPLIKNLIAKVQAHPKVAAWNESHKKE